MGGALCILGCRNFSRDIAAAVAAEGWTDVTTAEFPAGHGRHGIAWGELRPLLTPDCAAVLVLGSACLRPLGPPPADFPPTRLVIREQCFHLVAAKSLVADAVAGGGYLATPGWLAEWRGRLADDGFSSDEAGPFFREFAGEVVLLDTGTDADAANRLAEFVEAVGLPSRRLPVGLDHLRQMLAGYVLEWRLENERREAADRERRHTAEIADLVSAMDLFARLTRSVDEVGAIGLIEDLFHMLFAPRAVHFLPVTNGVVAPAETIPDATRDALTALEDDWAWTADGRGFLLRVGHGGEVVGRVAVDGLAFPQHRERYLTLALTMSGICGLAISNIRNRRKLVQAEKMASLGIVVAGVAHEINTPLGGSMLVASTLHEQTQQIARGFAERGITRSDFTVYLARARDATDMLRTNLERIGRLVEAFRKTAVAKPTLDKRRFKLRDCIEEAIRTSATGPSMAGVDIVLDCDSALQIEGLPGDWSSIVANLLTNSLHHGFNGRAGGTIAIGISTRPRKLTLDYRDDGNGIAPAIRAKIFDPFFTTDVQRGSGLGLYLVYNLVTHRMRGDIRCESEPGKGTRFLIEVPY